MLTDDDHDTHEDFEARQEDQSPSASRWTRLDRTSPSGKMLYQCGQCGRETATPDKTCVAGCKEPRTDPGLRPERPGTPCVACDGRGNFKGIPCGWCSGTGHFQAAQPCKGCGKGIAVAGPHHYCDECILRQRAERAESRNADIDAKLRWHEAYWRPPGDENNPVSIGVIWEQLKIAEARVKEMEAKLADAQFEATKWRNIAQGDIGMKSAYEHEALEHGATRERLEAAEARVKELEGSRQQARAEALDDAARIAGEMADAVLRLALRAADPFVFESQNRALLDCAAAIRAAKEVPGA